MYKNQAHHNMVEQQIRPWEVLDSCVLNAFINIPREYFVSEAQKSLAYTDTQLPIGQGQKMLEPKVEGRILQALDLKPTDTVLEVGTGSGFVTALLASLVKQVDSIEINSTLVDFAKENLSATNFENINLQTADALDENFISATRYQAMLLSGSVEVVPGHLLKMLRVGGKMLAFIESGHIAQVVLINKITGGHLVTKKLFETNSLPLQQTSKDKAFIF